MEKRWITPKETATYLSVNLKAVYRMIYMHQLPAVKIKGAGWRIDRRKLDKMLESKIEERERNWQEIFD